MIGEGELARDFLLQVGARIRELRTSRSLTVQQLADDAGISRRLLTQIELGQANPSLVTVTRIARRLSHAGRMGGGGGGGRETATAGRPTRRGPRSCSTSSPGRSP